MYDVRCTICDVRCTMCDLRCTMSVRASTPPSVLRTEAGQAIDHQPSAPPSVLRTEAGQARAGQAINAPSLFAQPQQLVQVQSLGDHHQLTIRILGPFVPGTIPVELHAVLVGIA